MTEFDYDVLQRKRLARQAKYKKNGSKSRKCTLRQDHMTNAQLKKMNGEVIKFNMNKPIRSWSEFRGLSRESAREYISNLVGRYSVSIGDLARMFGVSYNTVKKYLQSIDAAASAGRMPAELIPVWNGFLAEPDEPKVEVAPVEDEPKEEPVEERQAVPMAMRAFSLVFSGDLDIQGITNSLRYTLGDKPTGTVQIIYRADKLV